MISIKNDIKKRLEELQKEMNGLEILLQGPRFMVVKGPCRKLAGAMEALEQRVRRLEELTEVRRQLMRMTMNMIINMMFERFSKEELIRDLFSCYSCSTRWTPDVPMSSNVFRRPSSTYSP